MKLHFEDNLDYQKAAIDSVVNLFKGQEISRSEFTVTRREKEDNHYTLGLTENQLGIGKIIGWGWYYLSTILDDYSRYIIAWKLCTTMKATDVTDTLELALETSGCDSAQIIHKPRLLSDNGASYVAGELADLLQSKGMSHVRGAPYHPQTQGKIERWHQTLKNRVVLNNYYLPNHLEHEIGEFIEYYNHERYHESINNLTPGDVYFGRGKSILEKRRKLKHKTIQQRRLQHLKLAA